MYVRTYLTWASCAAGPSATSTWAARPPSGGQPTAYVATKAAKYVDQPNFVPFIGETVSGVPRLPNTRGTSGDRHFRGPSTQDVALRGVMQARVRIQAYMLASMVDLAVEAVV